MANRTVGEARNIHGTNPQYLIEKIIRSRIYDSKYWKEQCFALTAELLVDKAMELQYIGGIYGGNIKPTQFLCLILKMLQIQPEKDIIIEFIKNEEFKYIRALGAFYLRLTGTSLDCYKYLEPLYNDNRKLRRQNRMGQFEIIYMDEFIDELLRNDRVNDIILPRIQKRSILEELETKVSILDENLDENLQSDEDTEKVDERNKWKKRARSRSRSKSRDRHEKKSNELDEKGQGRQKRNHERDRKTESHNKGHETEHRERERNRDKYDVKNKDTTREKGRKRH